MRVFSFTPGTFCWRPRGSLRDDGSFCLLPVTPCHLSVSEPFPNTVIKPLRKLAPQSCGWGNPCVTLSLKRKSAAKVRLLGDVVDRGPQGLPAHRRKGSAISRRAANDTPSPTNFHSDRT